MKTREGEILQSIDRLDREVHKKTQGAIADWIRYCKNQKMSEQGTLEYIQERFPEVPLSFEMLDLIAYRYHINDYKY
jgi:hypothetical protein